MHALSYALAIMMTSWGSGQTEVQERVLQVEDGLELQGHMAEWQRLGYPVEWSPNE